MDIALSHVSKQYLHKTVLDNLSVVLQGGRIHALLGENGTGKSTTAAILSGALPFDSGSILIDGEAVHFSCPRDAVEKGIICVHQRPLLADDITVKENILLGIEYRTEVKKNGHKKILQEIGTIKKNWAPQLDMHTLVAHLGGDERFYTSLIAALACRPQVLILDEPSALLDWEQRRALYANIRELANEGMNVIVITHIMQEAELYTDTVTVLRKGKPAEQYENNRISGTKKNVQNTGRTGTAQTVEEESAYECHREACGTACGKRCAVSFSGVTVRPRKRPGLFDISFSAECGRLTLIKGLQESGLGTLENVITGMETAHMTGDCTIQTADVKQCVQLKSGKLSPSFLRKKSGIRTALIPSDRTFRASNPQLTIGQFLCAMRKGMVDNAYAEKIIKKADIVIRPDEKAAALSGGMLQRLIIARELDTDPQFIIACEPLQGLDIQTAERTTKLLGSLAAKGCIVLILSSSDFPMEICSTVYNLEGGKLLKAD
jgi:ABC-type uncharacterized transport system ATPase subunit